MPRATRHILCAVAAMLVATSCSSPDTLVFDASLADESSGEVLNPMTSEPTRNESSERLNESSSSGEVVDSATQAGVESAFSRLMSEWVACYHRPERCEVSPLTTAESPERQRLTESLGFYTTENIRTKPDEGRLQWSIESISLPSNTRARVVTCEYDTRIFFDTSMSDTEFGDIIFDTTVWTRRVEWTLARSEDSWSLWSRRIERRSPVARFCTP